MSDQLWGVLLGAAAASLVPLLTLRITHQQWRVEKKLELIRRKKDDLERIYADIFQKLPAALQERSYPISMMGAISVHACPEVRKLYFDHMDSKDREEANSKHLLLDMTVAANNHIASLEREIENILS